MTADFGMIGLAVMGSNLSKNIVEKGFSLAAWDISKTLADQFRQEMKDIESVYVYDELTDFVKGISKPRRIMLLIRAGDPVDQMIARLLPIMEPGDILIDGGNSDYKDTIRRCQTAGESGIQYVGMGVSGGEEGARNGPSLMPGCSKTAWDAIKPIFQKICAFTDDGSPCCDLVGENGAGHFVKMVHNGIEYGDMQLICETYHIMRDYLKMTNEEMADVFDSWNKSELSSYLIQITADILRFRDSDGQSVIDNILDCAGQKGTGKLASISAMNEGIPLTMISEAVFARFLSSQTTIRTTAAKAYRREIPEFTGDREGFLEDLRKALYASKIVSYAQGYALLQAAAKTNGWNLNYGGIALMWRGGCIIRSVFLGEIRNAFIRNPELENLLLDEYFQQAISSNLLSWRKVVSEAILTGIPVPAFSSAISWFDGLISEKLPANLLQAQRDYFGAHTYERIDRERGKYFHTNWTGKGGEVSSTTYNV